ncbi:hypothetical protein V6N13_123850 [Hibiscus sabdariffa]
MAIADRALAALNFPNSFRVEANGFQEEFGSAATFVYASPQSSKRKPLWDYIHTLSDHISEPWIALGFQGPNFTCRLVQDNWDDTLPLSATVENFAMATAEWNRVIFGSLSRRKQAIMARFRGLQKSIN